MESNLVKFYFIKSELSDIMKNTIVKTVKRFNSEDKMLALAIVISCEIC